MATSSMTERGANKDALNKISILESNNWQEFKRRANEFIILSGYEDLREEGSGEPEREAGETDRVFLQRKTAWKYRMSRACTAIKSRLGVNAHGPVEDETNLNMLMSKLETNCRDQGTGSLIELIV